MSRKDKSLGDIIRYFSGFYHGYYLVKQVITNRKEMIYLAWGYLIIAGTFEVVWAIALKYSYGFSKLMPSVVTIGGMITSFYFLSMATKTLPLGTAYAIWTGIGSLGTILLGVILFHEALNPLRIVFLSCILIGILGLKLTSA